MLTYPEIDPVAIDLGILQIRWYGLSYVGGIIGAWWLLLHRAKTNGLGWTEEQVADLIFYSTIGIILGGRLGSVLFYNLSYYLQHPLAVLKIWEGGMSFHGGLIGILVAILVFARRTDKPFFTVSDFLIPVIPVGLFSGRMANFINGELWGTPSDLPWAMIFPHPDAEGIARHPSQLYEAFFEGLVLFIVVWWFSAKPRPAMAVTGLLFVGYGISRSGIEFVREPDVHLGYLAGDWLTMGQVLTFPMIVIGSIFLWLGYRNNPVDRV